MIPLLLLHGYPFEHSMWSDVRSHLSQERPILVPDLRGFGATPTGNATPSLDVMAADLCSFMNEASINKAAVAGFSMGGYVALALAEKHPDRVGGLALINSQAAADTEAMKKVRQNTIEKVKADGVGAALEGALPKMFSTPEQANSPLAAFPRKGAEKAGVSGIAWALEAMANRPDRTEVLKSFERPTLILHSVKDQFLPVQNARDLAKSLSSAQYVELENAGHCSPLEQPDQVAEAIESWLTECP